MGKGEKGKGGEGRANPLNTNSGYRPAT